MKSLLLLINPAAGRGAFRDGLGDVLHAFHKAGYRPTVAFSDKQGDITRLTVSEAQKYDRVVCMGGDGTLGETMTGLMQMPAEERPALGYIPMGTANDYAYTLGLSHDHARAAMVAATGQPLTVDVGRLNGNQFFTYVAAFGAFTEVPYETPQDQKNMLGFLAYVLDGMRRLPNLTHRWTRVEYDDGVLEDDLILGAVGNTRSIASIIRMKDSPDISLNDGMFDVLLIRTPENILQLGPILTSFVTHNYIGEGIALLHTKKIRFTFRDSVAWTLDGEGGGHHKDVLCENIPHAVQMIVDPACLAREGSRG